MDFLTIIFSAASALGSGGLVGALCLQLVKHALQEESKKRDALENELKQLKENQLESIRDDLAKFERHIEADKSQEILATLKTMTGSITKLDDKLERYTHLTASQEARLAGLDGYVGRLDASLQSHKNDYKQHGG